MSHDTGLRVQMCWLILLLIEAWVDVDISWRGDVVVVDVVISVDELIDELFKGDANEDDIKLERKSWLLILANTPAIPTNDDTIAKTMMW